MQITHQTHTCDSVAIVAGWLQSCQYLYVIIWHLSSELFEKSYEVEFADSGQKVIR